MKNVGLGSALTLFLLILTTTPAMHAQTPGQAASGVFRFLLDDELLKTVDFDVRTDEKGFASGALTLTDEAAIPVFDDPEDPREGDPPKGFVMKAQIDSLTIEKNRALMNGFVVDSDHTNYIGRWVQLVVEDNRDNRELPDRLTWSFCKPGERGWIPSDAELDRDDGAFLHWWATDAERKDDVGIPSPNLIPGEDKSCPVHSLAAYSFADVLKWDGDIIVQP
jgi:hypothetical protein